MVSSHVYSVALIIAALCCLGNHERSKEMMLPAKTVTFLDELYSLTSEITFINGFFLHKMLFRRSHTSPSLNILVISN